MAVDNTPVQLAPGLAVYIHWTTQVWDFIDSWQRKLAEAQEYREPKDRVAVAEATINGVRQGRGNITRAMEDIYRLTGQLPASGELLIIGPLEVRVHKRVFETRRVRGVTHIDMEYYFNVEHYRCSSPPIALPAALSVG
jgi:hypothetical protein